MTLSRLEDYLEHMHQASADACSFVDGMSKSDFLQDKRTQQAVIMSFVILGEASRKIMDSYPEFVADQPTIPWRSMRGMRNRITHGYFDTNLDLVWDTLTNALPDLVRKIAYTRSQLG